LSLDFRRQEGILPSSRVERCSVTIVGCGAIGSHAAETLAKIGISSLVIWDDDFVEPHNLPNQGYRLIDLGKPKVVALQERLLTNLGVKAIAHRDRVGEDTDYKTNVVISAVDSMKARKHIWAGVQRSDSVELFIDGRMGAQFGQVFSVHPKVPSSEEFYEKHLFDDTKGHEAPCTEKATIHCAVGLVSWITASISAYIQQMEVPKLFELDFANFHSEKVA